MNEDAKEYLTMIERCDALETKILMSQVGSCTCGTKHVRIKWHAPTCLYVETVLLLETIDLIRTIKKKL